MHTVYTISGEFVEFPYTKSNDDNADDDDNEFVFYIVFLTLSVPNFRRYLLSAFLFLTNYRLKRSLHIKLKE